MGKRLVKRAQVWRHNKKGKFDSDLLSIRGRYVGFEGIEEMSLDSDGLTIIFKDETNLFIPMCRVDYVVLEKASETT